MQAAEVGDVTGRGQGDAEAVVGVERRRGERAVPGIDQMRMSSRFTQVTVVPAGTVSVAGSKVKLEMATVTGGGAAVAAPAASRLAAAASVRRAALMTAPAGGRRWRARRPAD